MAKEERMSPIDEEGTDIFAPVTELINALMAKVDNVMAEVRRSPSRIQLKEDVREIVREELERMMTEAEMSAEHVAPINITSPVAVPSTPTTHPAEATRVVEAKSSQSQKVWNWLKTH